MDPYEGNYQDPQSLHKYLYCHANPVNGVDPSGHEFSIPDLLVTCTIMTVVANLMVSAVFGYVAGENKLPDGAVVSAGINYSFAKTGFMVQSSVLFIWDFKTNELWWIWNPIEGGLNPISTFSTQGGRGFSLSAGFAFGMDQPNNFSGLGTVASWPLALAKYAPFAVTKARAYNMMMLLARRNTPGTKFYKQLNTIQFGVSTSGSVYFAIGRRDNSFTWTVGYGLPAKRLVELPEWLKPVGDFLSGRLLGLRPDSYDQLIGLAGEQRSF